MTVSKLQKFSLTRKMIMYTAVFAVLSLAAYLTLKKSLGLALIGDDWLLLYTIWQTFEVRKSMTFFQPRAYLCTYCPPHAYLSLIKYFWGYNPYYYYLANLFSKIFAGTGVFFVSKRISKRFWSGLLAGLLFVVSYIGIETTDWVFNMNHYAGVGLTAFFILSYRNLKEKLNIKNALITSLLFASGLIVSPPRMHGAFPLIILIEAMWLITNRKNYKIKDFLIRTCIVLITYRLVFLSGGYGTSGYLATIIENLKISCEKIRASNSEFVLNPLATFGNYIVPDRLLLSVNFGRISLFGKPAYSFFSFLFPVSLVFILISSFVLLVTKIGKRNYLYYLLSSGIWILFVRYFKRINSEYISNEKTAFILIGGLGVIFTLFLFTRIVKKNYHVAMLLLLGFFWMNTFSIFPWLLAPWSMLETWARYSVQQSAGTAIWAAAIITAMLIYAKKQKNTLFLSVITVLLAVSFFLMHFSLARDYINNLYLHRNEKTVDRLWTKIIQDVPAINKDKISVFYLTYDDYYMAEWGLRFGFSSRAALHYDIREQKNNPYMIFEYDDLLSMAGDGEALRKQGVTDPEQVSLDRIYAFRLENSELTDITYEIRERISEDLIALKKI